MRDLKALADKLERERGLSLSEWTALIEERTPELEEYIFAKARAVRERE